MTNIIKESDDVEILAQQIHKVYCAYYQNRHGKNYWTNGDYSLLDEETKEADRYMARFILKREFDNVMRQISSNPIDYNLGKTN
jgi:hypothetical protein